MMSVLLSTAKCRNCGHQQKADTHYEWYCDHCGESSIPDIYEIASQASNAPWNEPDPELKDEEHYPAPPCVMAEEVKEWFGEADADYKDWLCLNLLKIIHQHFVSPVSVSDGCDDSIDQRRRFLGVVPVHDKHLTELRHLIDKLSEADEIKRHGFQDGKVNMARSACGSHHTTPVKIMQAAAYIFNLMATNVQDFDGELNLSTAKERVAQADAVCERTCQFINQAERGEINETTENYFRQLVRLAWPLFGDTPEGFGLTIENFEKDIVK